MRACVLTLLLCLLAIPVAAQSAHCLVAAYPGIVCRVEANTLHFCDGTTLPFDDGQQKTHQDRLATPDLQDQLHIAYRTTHDLPAVDEESGRIRYEPFFKKIYGQNKAAVAGQLTPVRWYPSPGRRKVRFSTSAGAAKALSAVSMELAKLPAKFRKYLKKPPQTFVWRKIRKTHRLSAHSFGIALDIGIQWSDYWQWRKPRDDGTIKYRNRFPMEIVRIFEKHGFIWGGRWYRFDTMHFEYRPELLIEACRKQ